MDFTLPESDGLKIEYFGHLFDNTSECYKMFWFQVIVELKQWDSLSEGYRDGCSCRNLCERWEKKEGAPRQVYLRKLKGQIKKSSVDNMQQNMTAYNKENMLYEQKSALLI